MQAQHEDDVGALLVHAEELVAEGGVEVPANILRAHLRDGRSMAVGAWWAHGKGVQLNKGVYAASSRQTGSRSLRSAGRLSCRALDYSCPA